MKKIFILFVVYLLVVGAAAADEERLVRTDAADLNESFALLPLILCRPATVYQDDFLFSSK